MAYIRLTFYVREIDYVNNKNNVNDIGFVRNYSAPLQLVFKVTYNLN